MFCDRGGHVKHTVHCCLFKPSFISATRTVKMMKHNQTCLSPIFQQKLPAYDYKIKTLFISKL